MDHEPQAGATESNRHMCVLPRDCCQRPKQQLMQENAQDHLQLVWGWGSQVGWQHNSLALPDGDLPLQQEAPSQTRTRL